MSKARIIGLGFGVLLIVAAFGVVLWQTTNMPTTSTAFAQGGSTATPAPSTSGTTPTPAAQPTQQQIGDAFWNALATKLGVSADDLKSKAVATRQEMIDQAVKDGRITQAEGDAIKQRINENNLIAPIPLRGSFQGQGNQPGNGNGNQPHRGPFGGGFGNGGQFPGGFGGPGPMMGPGFGGFGGRPAFGASIQELTAIATALKLEPKALVDQLSQGKTLADIAKAQNVDEATVKQAIIDFRKAQIDQQLSLGLISEVQANELKANLTPDKIDLTRGFGMGMEMHRMPYGQQQAPNGQQQAQPTPTTQTQ